MKLKQADKPSSIYPNRYNFKPMILSVGVAVVLSGCAGNQVNSNSAKESVANKTNSNKVQIKKIEVKEEVKEPEALGGIPPIQPPIEPKNN